MTDDKAVGTILRAMRKGDRVSLFIGEHEIGSVRLAHVPNGAKVKVAFSFERSVRIEAERRQREPQP